MLLPAVLALALLLGPASAPVPGLARGQETGTPAPAEVVEGQLGGTLNVHRAGDLWFAGQFGKEDLQALVERGIERVIDLRREGERDWNERALVEGAGLEYVALPFGGPVPLTTEILDRARELLGEEGGPTLLHCASANRVGAVWLPYRVLDQGVELEQALSEAETIGLRTPGYEDAALRYVDRARQSQVPEGINDNFRDPELDVETYLDRFETESREVFTARHAILEALRVRPGDRVADIGAGTGLYTHLLTDVAGWVYAVDISPRFLEFINQTAAERDTRNLTTVLCPSDSTGLPPESVDLAFVCDTYHHFEAPRETMASLYRAVRPGGRVVVLDFERIPGVTRPWLLEHVRAGKEVFRSEIEEVGFAFRAELDVAGIEENYVLEFVKPAR